MQVRRALVIAVIALVLGASTMAAATSLTVVPKSLAAGTASVTTCQAAAFTVTNPVTSGGNVVSVDVGNITQACRGSQLSITLTTSANAALGPTATAAVPTGTGTTSVTVTGLAATAASVAKYFVAVVGP